ncbi:MAG: response regulator [Euryarchaeota archaeon]|nr:response regulator [Euryarchaeota archaeon]
MAKSARETDDMTALRPHGVLIVDDEVDILESLSDLFSASLDNAEIYTAESGARGLEILRAHAIDLIVADYKMPGMNGLEFLGKAKELAPGVPRVLVTAFPDLDIAIKAINDAGIENFFTKPIDPNQIMEVVRAILAERRTRELRDRSFARSLDVLRKRNQPEK